MVDTAVVATLAGQADGDCGNDDGAYWPFEATFCGPSGIAFASYNGVGTVYVADAENDLLRTISLPFTGVVATIAGQQYGWGASVDGVGTEASFKTPTSLAVDVTTGTIFLTEQDSHAIRTIDIDTLAVSTLAGKVEWVGEQGSMTITAVSGFVDGIGSNAAFYSPSGVALDPSTGNLFVADTSNHAVRLLACAGGFGSDGPGTCSGCGAGTGSSRGVCAVCPHGRVSAGFEPYPKYADSASFCSPCPAGSIGGIGADASDHSPNTCVLCPAGTRIAGSGDSCEVCPDNHYSDAGSEECTVCPVYQAGGTRVDPDSFFQTSAVGDTASSHAGAAACVADRAIVTLASAPSLIGSPNTGLVNGPSEDARFYEPRGVAFDPSTNTVFIADKGNR